MYWYFSKKPEQKLQLVAQSIDQPIVLYLPHYLSVNMQGFFLQILVHLAFPTFGKSDHSYLLLFAWQESFVYQEILFLKRFLRPLSNFWLQEYNFTSGLRVNIPIFSPKFFGCICRQTFQSK